MTLGDRGKPARKERAPESRPATPTMRPPPVSAEDAAPSSASLVVRFVLGAVRRDTVLHPGTSVLVGREARLSPEVLEALGAYSWPGNVRELRNVVERLALLATDGVADLHHLPEEVIHAPLSAPPSTPKPVPSSPSTAGADDDEPGSSGALVDELARIERARILDALEQCGGNQTRAAKMLGITRRVLILRLDRYGVTRPRK